MNGEMNTWENCPDVVPGTEMWSIAMAVIIGMQYGGTGNMY